jgi:hypothetical protein
MRRSSTRGRTGGTSLPWRTNGIACSALRAFRSRSSWSSATAVGNMMTGGPTAGVGVGATSGASSGSSPSSRSIQNDGVDPLSARTTHAAAPALTNIRKKQKQV